MERYKAAFKQRNTKWCCDVETQDGKVVSASKLCNLNTGQPWTAERFCDRYEMSLHDFLSLVAIGLGLQAPPL